MEWLLQAMLSNALVAAGPALVAAGFGRSGRSPALAHSLWLVVLLKLVTPPVVPVPLPRLAPDPVERKQVDVPAVEKPAETAGPVSLTPVDEETPFDLGAVEEFDQELGLAWPVLEEDRGGRSGSRSEENRGQAVIRFVRECWREVLLGLGLTGALVWWSLAAVRIIRFQRLLRAVRPAPAEWQERSQAVARTLGLRQAPVLWMTPGRVPPMLWALGGKARVLVPSELWTALDEDQRTVLLVHELAHLKRHDHWVRWLELVVAGLYWWNPVVWWARRGLREAEEQCCDAWVVWLMPREAKMYAAALLTALEFVSGAPTAPAPAAAAAISGNGHVSCLKRRLRMIVRAKTPRGLNWAGRFGVLGLAALLLPLAPTWAQGPDTDRETSSVTVKPESASLAVALRQPASQDQDKGSPEEKERDPAQASRNEAADQLEHHLKELGERLGKDLGPVGEEIRKSLEKAATEVNESLKKEGLSSQETGKAMERAWEEIRKAFELGGPVEREAREAVERARREMRQSWEKARQELREAMRYRLEERERERAERLRDDQEAAEDRERGGDIQEARRQVREIEQQLRRAVRRLEAIERREARLREREQRRGPGAPGEAPSKPEAPPRPPTPPKPPQTRETPESPEIHMLPGEVTPPRGPGAMRGPRGRGMMGGPGMMVGPGQMMGGPGMMNPRVENRLRELEEKMDRLLKELESLKSEKKEKSR